jgi:DNA invertase Pin-like site-specific DNA recombinase
MNSKQFVGYVRVSNAKSGGLDSYGVEAQKQAILRYVQSVVGSILLCIFEKVESGKKASNRPQLQAAIARCKTEEATLVIGRLDRLSRNASFTLALQESNLDFVCCDVPHADRFTIGLLALLAQKERELISERTKSGLAVARSQGKTLGAPPSKLADARKKAVTALQSQRKAFAEEAMKAIAEIQSTGVNSLNKISKYMRLRGIPTPRGGAWTACSVKRVLSVCG